MACIWFQRSAVHVESMYVYIHIHFRYIIYYDMLHVHVYYSNRSRPPSATATEISGLHVHYYSATSLLVY